jgi:hypothetical protein
MCEPYLVGLTFDVRGGRSRRRREPKAQLWAVPLDGFVSPLFAHGAHFAARE